MNIIMLRSYLGMVLLFAGCLSLHGQPLTYTDSIKEYQKKYVDTHDVVKGSDRDFLSFYAINEKYRVVARFEKIADTTGFIMKTSGPKKKKYFRYGMLYFKINKTDLHLTIYQSESLMADTAYKNYLFVPFTDMSSGEKSYGGGRYLDFLIDDIKKDHLVIDFNKCYNPYCAYVTGYSCPIPPAENDLPVLIPAGEMEYKKKH